MSKSKVRRWHTTLPNTAPPRSSDEALARLAALVIADSEYETTRGLGDAETFLQEKSMFTHVFFSKGKRNDDMRLVMENIDTSVALSVPMEIEVAALLLWAPDPNHEPHMGKDIDEHMILAALQELEESSHERTSP